MRVLYCIGEKSEEQPQWEDVLGEQLRVGLDGVDRSKVVIGYEPVWSIGPGKTPAGKEYITKIARFVKDATGGMDIVYGGGLKTDNAEMLGVDPGDRRRIDRADTLLGRDRVLPRGVSGDYTALSWKVRNGNETGL